MVEIYHSKQTMLFLCDVKVLLTIDEFKVSEWIESFSKEHCFVCLNMLWTCQTQSTC